MDEYVTTSRYKKKTTPRARENAMTKLSYPLYFYSKASRNLHPKDILSTLLTALLTRETEEANLKRRGGPLKALNRTENSSSCDFSDTELVDNAPFDSLHSLSIVQSQLRREVLCHVNSDG